MTICMAERLEGIAGPFFVNQLLEDPDFGLFKGDWDEELDNDLTYFNTPTEIRIALGYMLGCWDLSAFDESG